MNTEYWCKRGHFNEDQYNYVRELPIKENPKYCLETGFYWKVSIKCII